MNRLLQWLFAVIIAHAFAPFVSLVARVVRPYVARVLGPDALLDPAFIRLVLGLAATRLAGGTATASAYGEYSVADVEGMATDVVEIVNRVIASLTIEIPKPDLARLVGAVTDRLLTT